MLLYRKRSITAWSIAAFLVSATAPFAAIPDSSIISYHWQLSQATGFEETYVYQANPSTTYPAANLPALLDAGSRSALPLQVIKYSSSATLLKETDMAKWLIKNSDGKQYGIDFYGYPIEVRTANDNGDSFWPFQNKTFWVVTRKAGPYFEIYHRYSNTFYITVQTNLDNDTLEIHSRYPEVRKKFPVLLNNMVASGEWLPYFVRFRQDGNDSIQVEAGIAGTVLASGHFGSSQSYSGTQNASYIYSAGLPESEATDAHLFITRYTDTQKSAAYLWNTFFADSVMPGPDEKIDLLIHNIIYDPPGNQSYSTVQFDTTTETSIDYNWSANVGGSVEAGTRGSVSIGEGVSISQSWVATAKLEAYYRYDNDRSTTIGLSSSTTQSSMTDDADELLIGPSFGDVVVYQQLKYRINMLRRPLLSHFRTAVNPDDYVYAVSGCTPLPEESSVIHYTPVSTLVSQIGNDSALMAFLQREYPYDLKTGRLLPSALVPGVNHHGESVPPRVSQLENQVEITGNLPYDKSTSREDIAAWNESDSWGVAVTADLGYWGPGPGFEITISGGADFVTTRSGSGSSNSTIAYHLQDGDSWDIYRITPCRDMRFKTVLFMVDSVHSFTSFPYEHVNSRPAVTWAVEDIAAVHGYVGQATEVKVRVKNTSPAALVPKLPAKFQFSVSAVNFQGTVSVIPENAQIATDSTVEFTCTFTGAKVDSVMQHLSVICYHPSNGSTMEDDHAFRLVLAEAPVGLVVDMPEDTVSMDRDTSTVYHSFTVNLVNTGIAAAAVEFGAVSAGPGTSASYGSFPNPVEPGDTARLVISLTGDGKQEYYTATFWAQINGASQTRSQHTLVIRMIDPAVPVRSTASHLPAGLAMKPADRGRIILYVPADEAPQLSLFSIQGRTILRQRLQPGITVLDVRALGLPNGYYIARMCGAKTVQEKILVSGR